MDLRRLLYLAALLCLGFFFGTRLARGADTRRPMPVILVDPGHGGFDGGCGARSALLEKDLNLAVGQSLTRRLDRIGLRVFMTRSDDRHLGPTHRKDLLARVEKARVVRADAVICLHADWSGNNQRHGPCVFYHHDSGASRLLAELIQSQLNALAGTSYPPLPARDLLVIREAKRPAVLVEVGFLSNPDEARQLAGPGYQDALANAIADAVVHFLLVAG